MYSVKVEPIPDDNNYRNRLVVVDNNGERDHWDGGEPEDNSFIRDWSWVKDELLKAYEQGKVDGSRLVVTP